MGVFLYIYDVYLHYLSSVVKNMLSQKDIKKEKVPSLILYFHQIGLLLEKESQLEHPVLKIGDDDYILLLDLFLDKKRYLSMR